MTRRFTWSWEDYYRMFPGERPGAVTAEVVPFPAPAKALPPAPCPLPCLPDAGESAQLRRARELLAMGVDGAMVRRCVALSAAECLALWGHDEPGL